MSSYSSVSPGPLGFVPSQPNQCHVHDRLGKQSFYFNRQCLRIADLIGSPSTSYRLNDVELGDLRCVPFGLCCHDLEYSSEAEHDST